MTQGNTFHPTLWRTCRVLANPKRLACLRAVMGTPNLCVEEIAREAGLDEVQGSMALRALQARGLIAAYRHLRKLSARRVVAVQDDTITLLPHQNLLARTLLGLNASNE